MTEELCSRTTGQLDKRTNPGPPFQDLTSGWKQPESDNDNKGFDWLSTGSNLRPHSLNWLGSWRVKVQTMLIGKRVIPLNTFWLFALVILGTCFCPSDYVQYENHWYKLYSDTVNYDTAKSSCEGLSGYLPEITSAGENNFIKGNQLFKDVLMGIPKIDLSGITVALIHEAGQWFLAVWNGLNLYEIIR